MSIKYIVLSAFLSPLFLSHSVFANDLPDGNINFHNASNKNVTAQVSSVGKFNIAANESKSVSYSTLAQVCPQTNCTAHFYVDNTPAGTATINISTGKLVSSNLVNLKVHTAQSAQVLRTVVIK